MMSGIPPIAAIGARLDAIEFRTAYQAAVLRLQKDLIQDVGQAAIKLIQSATIDPAIGQHLDIRG